MLAQPPGAEGAGPFPPAGPVRPGPSGWPVIAAISAGGVLGAIARYGLTSAFPPDPAGFAWATFAVNVSGCFLMGVLMVAVELVVPGRALVRPFLGVGVLGGYTTFSAYSLDAYQAWNAGAAQLAVVYLAGTLIAALVAVWAGSALTRRAVRSKTGRS